MDEMEHFHFLFAFIDHLLYVSKILVAKHTINKTSSCPQGAYSQCIKIIIWMRVVTAKKKDMDLELWVQGEGTLVPDWEG